MNDLRFASRACLVLSPILLVAGAAPQDAPEANWPEGAREKVDSLLEIKVEAMGMPSTRSLEGELGRRAESLMDQLGPLVSDDSDFDAILQINGDQDIRARIALWAADRQRRPDEYSRFANWYVNYPDMMYPREGIPLEPDVARMAFDEFVEYFYRPHRNRYRPDFLPEREPRLFVPRHRDLSRPNPVDADDMVARNRYILEYCFFMPPTGRAFGFDTHRAQLAHALLNTVSPEQSIVVFHADADLHTFEITVDREVPGHWFGRDGGAHVRNDESYWFLMNLPVERSFRVLSELSMDGPKRDFIRESFANAWDHGAGRRNWRWSSSIQFPWNDEARLPHHAAWLELAGQDWETYHEKDFAEWIRAQRVKETPPPVNPAPPPFGPG